MAVLKKLLEEWEMEISLPWEIENPELFSRKVRQKAESAIEETGRMLHDTRTRRSFRDSVRRILKGYPFYSDSPSKGFSPEDIKTHPLFSPHREFLQSCGVRPNRFNINDYRSLGKLLKRLFDLSLKNYSAQLEKTKHTLTLYISGLPSGWEKVSSFLKAVESLGYSIDNSTKRYLYTNPHRVPELAEKLFGYVFNEGRKHYIRAKNLGYPHFDVFNDKRVPYLIPASNPEEVYVIGDKGSYATVLVTGIYPSFCFRNPEKTLLAIHCSLEARVFYERRSVIV